MLHPRLRSFWEGRWIQDVPRGDARRTKTSQRHHGLRYRGAPPVATALVARRRLFRSPGCRGMERKIVCRQGDDRRGRLQPEKKQFCAEWPFRWRAAQHDAAIVTATMTCRSYMHRITSWSAQEAWNKNALERLGYCNGNASSWVWLHRRGQRRPKARNEKAGAKEPQAQAPEPPLLEKLHQRGTSHLPSLHES